MGHRAILRNETLKDEKGNYIPSLDLELDGKIMDIKSITSTNNYGYSLCNKNRQLGNIKRKTGFVGDSVCLYFHDAKMFSKDKLINDAEWYKNYIIECGSKQRIKHIYIVVNGNKDMQKIDI